MVSGIFLLIQPLPLLFLPESPFGKNFKAGNTEPDPKDIQNISKMLEKTNLDKNLHESIVYFLACSEKASGLLKEVFDTIPEKTRLKILRNAAELWMDKDEDPDSTAYEYLFAKFAPELLDSIKEPETKEILSSMLSLDYSKLYTAYLIFSSGIDSLRSVVSDSSYKKPDNPGTLRIDGVEGTILTIINLSFGQVVIGGSKDNTYRKDFPIIIDIGGNDTYYNRAGFALGYLFSFVSAVIDLNGDDRYESKRTSFHWVQRLWEYLCFTMIQEMTHI